MIEIQSIAFPEDCRVTNHDFYNYDPVNSFNEEHSLTYLNEDLLQCVFPEEHMIIDLGWYGNLKTNEGEFRIYIVINENWEYPFNVIHSKSVDEIKTLLTKTLEYCSKTNYKSEN